MCHRLQLEADEVLKERRCRGSRMEESQSTELSTPSRTVVSSELLIDRMTGG